MRYLVTLGLLLLAAAGARAQYVPNSGQVFQFSSSFNPAFAGVEDFTDIKLGGRYQWAGYGDNAPKFLNAVANFRLKQPLDMVTNGVRMSNTNILEDRTVVPRTKQIIHGFGVSVFHEKVGLVNRVGGGVNYSFNYPISPKMRLAFGAGAIIENVKLGIGDVYLGAQSVPDQYYNYLMTNSSSQTEINVRGGVLLYSKKFYVGFSYLPIVTSVIKSSDISFNDPFYRGTAQAGVSLPVSAGITLKPSIMALWLTDNDFSIQYNIKAYIQRKLWLGVSYLDTKSTIWQVGFNFNELLGASYSYEMSMNGFKQFSDGSHDLVLSLRLNNFKRQDQYTW